MITGRARSSPDPPPVGTIRRPADFSALLAAGAVFPHSDCGLMPRGAPRARRSASPACGALLELAVRLEEAREKTPELSQGDVFGIELQEPRSPEHSTRDERVPFQAPHGLLNDGKRRREQSRELARVAPPAKLEREQDTGARR